MSKNQNIAACLTSIGIEAADVGAFFEGTYNLGEEFGKIKKAYYKKVLVAHPDKGGDAEAFRTVQTAFELLRGMFEGKKVDSFAKAGEAATDKAADVRSSFERPPPSWTYFYNAAEVDVPLYRVELAKSGRSRCKQKGTAKKCDEEGFIPKGEVRIGVMDKESGTYGRWCHLPCWRVASKIWQGLPDPDTCQDESKFEDALLRMNEVLFCGLDELGPEDRSAIVRYCMDKGNYAAVKNRKTPPAEAASAARSSSSSSSNSSSAISQGASASAAPTSSAVVASRGGGGHFIVPRPGRDGAIKHSLAGKTCVMTGVFPELGGGAGLNLGKDRCKAMIESFGGRVTSAVSGQTDVLVVGKEPGYSKVSKARGMPKCTLLALKDLVEDVIKGGLMLTDGSSSSDALTVKKKDVVIESFSAGFRSRGNGFEGNSAAYFASAEELAIAPLAPLWWRTCSSTAHPSRPRQRRRPRRRKSPRPPRSRRNPQPPRSRRSPRPCPSSR